MRLWKLTHYDDAMKRGGLEVFPKVVYIAHHVGEQPAALYRRAKDAMGVPVGQRWIIGWSDHSEHFYVGRRSTPALFKGELVEMEEPMGPLWRKWLRETLGTRMWCVAARMTDGLRREGVQLALSQRRFNELKAAYITTQEGISK